MKDVCRDFTIIVAVPDDTKLEDCEIIIVKLSASYIDKDTKAAVPVSEDDISLIAEEPYDG